MKGLLFLLGVGGFAYFFLLANETSTEMAVSEPVKVQRVEEAKK